jgi:4-hydroxy-tetrahydrodipicolinate synthase
MFKEEAMFQDNRIRGVLAPVLTPFTSNLSPDPQRFIAHCRWLISQNCGLAVFGTNSEANSLSTEERLTLLDQLVAAGVEPSRIMPGTGCCSIGETIKLTSHDVKHGCAGVLMLPPFYYKEVTEEGLYRYFSEVVQRVGDARLKIYLYHIPAVAIVGITARLVERLLKAYAGSVAGMKDSSGDWNNTKTFLDAFAARAGGAVSGFDVFVGSESFLLANIRNGGAGTISATANVNPAAIHSLFAEARQEAESRGQNEIGDQKSGSRERNKRPTSNAERPTPNYEENPPAHELSARLELERQQAKLNLVRDVFARTGSMIAPLKQAIAIYADDAGWARVRPPLVGLTTKQAGRLAAELKAIGFTTEVETDNRESKIKL